MKAQFWWVILIAVLIGAVIAGSMLAVQYAKQQVPQDRGIMDAGGTQ